MLKNTIEATAYCRPNPLLIHKRLTIEGRRDDRSKQPEYCIRYRGAMTSMDRISLISNGLYVFSLLLLSPMCENRPLACHIAGVARCTAGGFNPLMHKVASERQIVLTSKLKSTGLASMAPNPIILSYQFGNFVH